MPKSRLHRQLRLDPSVARVTSGIVNAMHVVVDHNIHEIGVVDAAILLLWEPGFAKTSH